MSRLNISSHVRRVGHLLSSFNIASPVRRVGQD